MRIRAPIPQDVALRLQLAAITGNEPESSFTEIRPLHPAGRQWWIPVRELNSAATMISTLAADRNVYVSAAPRTCRSGKADAVKRVWCLWADCDSDESVERLRSFQPRPSLVVRSGTADNLHAWWPLRKPIPARFAKYANRRLALALRADRAATDAARVLRPIGSLNHKHAPPVTVECVRLEVTVFTVTDVVAGLPDPPPPPPARRVASPTDNDARVAGLVNVVRNAQPGNRNCTLFWAASRARDDGLDVHAQLRCAALDAGLSESEIDATLASALDRSAVA